MKKILLLAALALCVWYPTSRLLAKQLDYESIIFQKIAPVKDGEANVILVRGATISSAYVVKNVSIKNKNGEANILVDAGLNLTNNKSLTGDFSVKVPATSDLKRITYGPNHVEIWPEKAK